LKGLVVRDAPVSNTIGRVGEIIGPTGVVVGTESEVVGEVTTATIGLATKVVEAADVGSTVVWKMSPMRASNR